MRKTMLVAVASVFGICVLVIAAKAATTWQGPPTNCTSPEGSSCNTDGVIWNRATPQQTGSFNLSGAGILGSGLTVQSGGATVSGDVNANSLIYLQTNGDLRLTDAKSIRIDKNGSQAQLYIGNFGTLPSNIKVTIFGDLETATEGGPPAEGYATKISTPTLCLNGDCKSAWPSGGGGTVTGATANGGLVLSGTTLGLSTSCANGQILKWNGAAWACAADGGGAGTVTSITAANGITATPNPITGAGTIGTNIGSGLKYFGSQIIIDNTFSGFDTKYIYKNQNDTTSGTITINSAGAYGLDSTGLTGVIGRASNANQYGVYGWGGASGAGVYGYSSGNMGVYGNGGNYGVYGYSGYMGIYGNGGTYGVYGAGPTAGSFVGNSGYYSNLGTAGNSIYASGPASFSNGNVTVANGNSLCLGADCRSVWPGANSCAANQISKWNGTSWICAADATGGTGDVTDVLAGTGITVTNPTGPQPTINVADNYVLNTGDTMTGDLNVAGGIIKLQQSPAQLMLQQPVNTNGPIFYSMNGPAAGKRTYSHLSNMSVAGDFGYVDAANKTQTHVYLTGSTYGVSAYANNLSGASAGTFSYLDAGGSSQYRVDMGNSSYAIDSTGPVRLVGDVAISGGTSDLSVGGELTAPTNRFGTAGANYSTSPCVLETNLFNNANTTYRRGCLANPGYFMAGIEYSFTSPYQIQGVWCCPL